MTDTQKRIKAYKDALPGIKERLAAVALLLVISIAMVTSATFAWLTISRNPEVSGVNMSVAANGNLEVALVAPDGSLPGKSAVGDSSATKGQTIAGANITWGNLVNLSDPSYGLEHLVLRPAQLNTASLLSSPLYGAVYSKDGRITQLNSSFGYTVWTEATESAEAQFSLSSDLGVRAISSLKIDTAGTAGKYNLMLKDARDKNLAAANTYSALAKDAGYMNSLATMMGLYMTARLNSDDAELSNPTCSVEDLENLRDMYGDFLDAYYLEAEAIAAMINLQQFSLSGGTENYTPYTADMIIPKDPAVFYTAAEANSKATALNNTLTKNGIQVTGLVQFLKDRNTIASDYQKLVDLCSAGTSLQWSTSGLNGIVNNLVNVGTCTVGGTAINNIGMKAAINYINGTHEARITNGILKRFEERTGGYIRVEKMKIKATIALGGSKIAEDVEANIQTDASRDFNHFGNDLAKVEAMKPGNFVGGNSVAQDTYGLAVDLWVRTNAVGSFLTLEGNVLANTEYVDAVGKDANGNVVDIYTVTLSGGEDGGEYSYYTLDLYQMLTTVEIPPDPSDPADESTEPTEPRYEEVMMWYNADTHTLVPEEDLGGKEPVRKREAITNVYGYEGENRVWEDNALLSIDATTQGSGSCYVYYADTPEDQARSLKLLEAFNVAFVDAEGKLLATAVMDTENYFAANGRVVVPLILSTGNSIDLGTDDSGINHYAITALEQNVPMRITALVYLDGTKLTNQEVLAASDIQGQLNIQFGSNQSLEAISNEDLENAIRKVEATVVCSSGNNQTSGFVGSEANYDVVFNYDTVTSPMTVDVTVAVTGDKPNKVEAFFLRSISASQGSREKEELFTPQPDGTWKATFTFDDPGSYILRTIRLDGVDYNLADMPTVLVKGFTVKNLTCGNANTARHISIMTAENSRTVEMSLEFASDDIRKMPQTVQGRFLREDGTAANVQFTYDTVTGKWKGKATFLSSGDYTLQYLILNGQYEELPQTLWYTATVTLGMRVEVYTTSPHTYKYVPSEMTQNQKELEMQVKILDNEGNEMLGLTGTKLTYIIRGTSKFMDTDLIWNGTYYVGKLDALTAGPGRWTFGNVQVGSDNTLTTAVRQPTFTIQSPNPPDYYAHMTAAEQFSPENKATMNVQLTYSDTAEGVRALIVNRDTGAEHWVSLTPEQIGQEGVTANDQPMNHWNFPVPKDVNGYQDGNWQLTTVEVWGVYDSDGKLYTEDEPMVFDVSDTNNVTKVVSRVNVTIEQLNETTGRYEAVKSMDFGKSGNTVDGMFMEEYDLPTMRITISDFEGDALPFIKNVKLAVTYGNRSCEDYGGYTTALTNADLSFNILFEDSGNGTVFTQKDAHKLWHAGSYTVTMTYNLNNETNDRTYTSDSMPKYTVSSVTPTVYISDITLDGGAAYSVDTNTENSIADTWTVQSISSGCLTDYKYTMHTASEHKAAGSNTRIENNNTTAWIYFKCTHTDAATYDGGTRNGVSSGPESSKYDGHNYLYDNGNGVPAATLTITGMGNADEATLTFTKTGGGDVIMITQYVAISAGYEGNYQNYGTDSYIWSNPDANGNATCKRFIGVMKSGAGSNNSDTKQAAGTITANQLVLTYNGKSFLVTIPTITIHNPY